MVVYTKGLREFGGIAIGGNVGLDIFFLAFSSGASMNPGKPQDEIYSECGDVAVARVCIH